MANALNEVYEPRFLGCSYGFRPGRSAHDVVRYINKTIMTHKVNYVMEADIVQGLSQILCKHRNAVQIEQNLFKAEVAQAAAALFSK